MLWYDDIISIPDLSLKATSNSGLISCSYGSTKFKLTAFDDDENNHEPPDKCLVDLKWGLSSNMAFQIHNGTIFLREYDHDCITYDVWKPALVSLLLDKGVDATGKECAIPVVFGDVIHMTPQQTESRNGYQTFYYPNFANEIGDGVNAYESGTLINDGWVNNGDGTVTRKITISDELTFCGISDKTTIAQIFEWACVKMGIEFVNKHSGDWQIDSVPDQMTVLEYLEKISYYAFYRFYIRDGILTLVDLEKNNGSTNLTQYSFTEPVYSYPDRIKTLESNWTTRKIIQETGFAAYMGEEEHSIKLWGNNREIGNEEDIGQVFNNDESKVSIIMEKHLVYLQKPDVKFYIPITRFPSPIEEISFFHTRANAEIRGVVKAEGINMSYSNKTVSIEGKCDLTFE